MFKPPQPKVLQKPLKQELQSLPFQELAEICSSHPQEQWADDVIQWADQYGIQHKSWVYPQILAHIGRWTLSRDETGLYSPRQLLADNVSKDPFNQGVYFFVMSDKRFVKTQNDGDNRFYCGLVPIILASFKKMMGIKYTDWNRGELYLLVNPALYLAMTVENLPDYSTEDLLEFRKIGLTVKSQTSKRSGTLRPVTSYGLNGLPHEWNDEPGPNQLPALTRIMICQTWCAHPSARNEYMVLDPNNWDLIPPSLIEANPIPTTKGPNKLPWE